MKKKIIFAVLPLLALASCATSPNSDKASLNNEANPVVEKDDGFIPYVEIVNGQSVIHRSNSEHTTYLMLSKYGSIEDYAGVSTKGTYGDFENTVVLKAEPGTLLPDLSQVKTSVDGASFRGWAYYDEDNDHVWPDYYTTVPAKDGLALKAIFDGTKTSGGGGSGGGGGDVPQTAKYGIIFSDDTKVFGTPAGTDYAGRNQYLISGQSFKVGDVFSLYDSSTGGKWAIDLDAASFGGDSSYITVDTANGKYTVNKAFQGNLYIKLSMQVGDQLYIGLI